MVLRRPGRDPRLTLADQLFALDGVESVLIDDSTVTVTRKAKEGDWKALASEIGARIRAQLESSDPAVAATIAEQIPAEDIRTQIRRSSTSRSTRRRGTSGHISLTAVLATASTSRWAAVVGLQRRRPDAEGRHPPLVPHRGAFVGAIYDETDHKAELNPYFR
ncbi:MAG: NifU N-terminal domain-containing protein [bacterium]